MTSFIRVEYDLNYWGGEYSDVGSFALLPMDKVEANGFDVEKTFAEVTGHDAAHIIHFCPDEVYDANENLIET